MATRFSKLFLALSFVCLFSCAVKGQQEDYISDVYIDGVKMESSEEDYRTFFKGKTISDKLVWDDEEEENKRIATFEGDSLFIFMSAYDKTNLYTKYIEIFSARHTVTFHNMEFHVGMNIDSLALRFPELKQRYEAYIGRNDKLFSEPAYFGKQLLIKMDMPNLPFYPCQGLKFKIKEGIVISILVDFRTDGDF